MSQAEQDLDQLRAALDQIGARLANDPEYREQLRNSENQPAVLYAAGVSTAILSGALEEAGAEESEVAAFGMDLGAGSGGGDPNPIKVNTICVTPKIGSGSCRNLTVCISIKATGRNCPG
jgi:hypothetical protein